ncbi:aminoglycoside phosphotransferase family protein [Leifsonia poae]|uniref:aminoglycoside phosphotransferase family protein n=1 Tax=Leifsonia poae TaxID=110933 RepID=UPI001CBEB180|nr:aminoglycoside phosphotransferase family protein [Leifsonia poae]
MPVKMHTDQLDFDAADARRLLSAQFPVWADLPLSRVASGGTVNALFRLGDDLAVRMPLVEREGASIRREAEWLPRLSPGLPVPIPTVQAVGAPDACYPCPWLVTDWLPGEVPIPDPVRPGADGLALDLAAFLTALRAIDPTDAPRGYRGGDLAALDLPVRECLERVADLVDVDRLLPVWESALTAPPWADEPVWVHADLLPGNVLLDPEGRLAAVLDFATAGLGDPSCDLMAAWSMLPAPSREGLRSALDADDAFWDRGRGWALSQAAIALPYYRSTNPVMATNSRHILAELSA